ncbi:MAG: RluA family pseudouridine synthase [Spirochaetales bacterium]|nr:RluA family pseudouridine synthase [Spirochaetales bacterium]
MEEMKVFIAGKDDDDRRLDRVLRKLLPGIPLSAVYTAMRRKRVLLNNRTAEGNLRVHQGDRISLSPSLLDGLAPPDLSPVSRKISLTILLETPSILAVSKPAGIAVHGSASLTDVVASYLQGKGTDSLSFRPGPLHRLDKDTTGLIFFGKTLEGSRRFSSLLQSRRTKKYYLALLDGILTRQCAWRGPVEGRDALSLVYPLATSDRYSLACIRLVTGRKHQIRLQAAEEGYPLTGDRKYGGGNPPGYILHSYALLLPEEDRILGFKDCYAPLPQEKEQHLKSLFGATAFRQSLQILGELRNNLF